MPEKFEQTTTSIEMQETLDYIALMMQECNQMGNNDSEFDLLRQLSEAVKNGSITPASAKEQAFAIRYGKIER